MAFKEEKEGKWIYRWGRRGGKKNKQFVRLNLLAALGDALNCFISGVLNESARYYVINKPAVTHLSVILSIYKAIITFSIIFK